MKLRVGIDIDGCLYPWTQAVNEALVAKFEIADPGEHVSWNHLQDSITPKQWKWAWSSEAVDVVFGRLDLIYPGAARAVNELCQEYEVHFVTHRHPRRVAGVTGRWLNYHFRNYAGVHVLTNSCPKYSLGWWDVFIDDKAETIEGFLVKTDALMLCPRRPWNKELEKRKRLVRFSAWESVPTIIERSGR